LKFIPANATKLAEFAASLLRPGRLLLKLKNQLRVIFIAVEDEGVWGYMRGRGGKLLESERDHWKNNKERWRALGNQSAEKEAAREDKVGQINDGLKKEQVPADSEGTTKQFDEDASKLNEDVDKIDRDVKGEPEKGATAVGAAEKLPKDYIEWE